LKTIEITGGISPVGNIKANKTIGVIGIIGNVESIISIIETVSSIRTMNR